MFIFALLISLPVLFFYVVSVINTTQSISWYIYIKDKINIIKNSFMLAMIYVLSILHIYFILAVNELGIIILSLTVIIALVVTIIPQKQ